MFFRRRRAGRRTPAQAQYQAHQSTADGRPVMLDVREGPECRAGHAPGALHRQPISLMAGATGVIA
ncbi:hypothetical protein [Streptomyces sp. NPDC055287]